MSSKSGGRLRRFPGSEQVKAPAWRDVQQIVDQFESLNPYDRSAVSGSILNFVDANYENSDPGRARRQLLGYSIAAKRYALYERTGNKINVVDPKAHGLGYLYPPADSPKEWEDDHDAPKWIYQFWEALLRNALEVARNDPGWIKRPQMMRMAVTTFSVLQRLHTWEAFRPYNFFLLPILAMGGCPAGVDPKHFTLVAPFESDQKKWLGLACINIAGPNDRAVYKLSTSFTSPEYSKRAVLEVFEDLLYRYPQHPEAKSLGSDGRPCDSATRGLLRRAHVIAGKHRRIGKEHERRWEEGDDLESLLFMPVEYEEPGERQERAHLARE